MHRLSRAIIALSSQFRQKIRSLKESLKFALECDIKTKPFLKELAQKYDNYIFIVVDAMVAIIMLGNGIFTLERTK
jgi:hypothetical protein